MAGQPTLLLRYPPFRNKGLIAGLIKGMVQKSGAKQKAMVDFIKDLPTKKVGDKTSG